MIAQPPKHLNTISIHFRFELNFRFNLDRYHTSILAVIFSGQAAYGRQITRVSLSLSSKSFIQQVSITFIRKKAATRFGQNSRSKDKGITRTEYDK